MMKTWSKAMMEFPLLIRSESVSFLNDSLNKNISRKKIARLLNEEYIHFKSSAKEVLLKRIKAAIKIYSLKKVFRKVKQVITDFIKFRQKSLRNLS